MPDGEQGAPVDGQGGSAAPASSPGAETKTVETVSMTKAEFDAFIKAQIEPWQKKHSDSEAAFGQYKKRASVTEEQIAASTNFEDMKAIVTALGVDPEDIKDAETVRDLKLLLRGYAKSGKAAPKGKPADPEGYAAFEAWKAQQAAPTGQGLSTGFTQATARGGAVVNVTAQSAWDAYQRAYASRDQMAMDAALAEYQKATQRPMAPLR